MYVQYIYVYIYIYTYDPIYKYSIFHSFIVRILSYIKQVRALQYCGYMGHFS